MNKELQFLIYNTPQENVKIDVVVKDETIWITQKSMAELFDVQVPAINKHLKNIFEEGELDEKVVVSKMEITTVHGAIADKMQTRDTNFYNLDTIISVGYRVNSAKATKFRIWATKVLKEFITKCSIDYSSNSQMTQDFYATIQNKFHFAITGQTVAEIIYTKADKKAEAEYNEFNKTQKILSDFDKEVKKIMETTTKKLPNAKN
jgi:hypothetical protein